MSQLRYRIEGKLSALGTYIMSESMLREIHIDTSKGKLKLSEQKGDLKGWHRKGSNYYRNRKRESSVLQGRKGRL